MKVANVDLSQALDATQGRRSTKNAGSRGITFRTAAVEAHPVRDLTIIGGTLTDNDDGTAVLTVGGSTTGEAPDFTALWDRAINKSADQSVTNSSTLVNDTELLWAVTTSQSWRFELMILYVSDATGDYKCDLAISASTMNVVFRYLGSDTTTNTVLVSTGIKDNVVTSTTDIAAGGGSLSIVRQILIEGYVHVAGAATISFRFAQNTTTAGQSAVTKAGSRLLLRQLA